MDRKITFEMPWFRRKLYLSTKPYFMIKNRGAGEKDLEELANSEEIEGAWLFTSDDFGWYNVGFETLTEENGLAVGVKVYILNISKMGPATQYHIHPKPFEEMLNNKLIAEKNAKEMNIKESDIRRFGAINTAIPSIDDIIHNGDFLGSNPGCAVDFRIVSPYGVTRVDHDCTPDKEAIEMYRKARSAKIMGDVVCSCQDTKSAVLSMLDKINQEMKGVLKIAIDYRGRCDQ